VRKSVKGPGWASLMTLLSDTAYHSFIGEVEALNTTTIRRLTRSRRHQLLAIAQYQGHPICSCNSDQDFAPEPPEYTSSRDALKKAQMPSDFHEVLRKAAIKRSSPHKVLRFYGTASQITEFFRIPLGRPHL
jgi:hypothetical protein